VVEGFWSFAFGEKRNGVCVCVCVCGEEARRGDLIFFIIFVLFWGALGVCACRCGEGRRGDLIRFFSCLSVGSVE
jgi:hypothetical protein